MTQTVSTSDVNRLASLFLGLIRGEVVATGYANLASDYDGASSKNWDEVACAADLIAFFYGNRITNPIEKLLGFLDYKLSIPDYMRGEGWIF